MYPVDQPNPGYGTEPSRPSPMTPSATPPSHPGPGTSRYIIIVCVVLALVIAGVVAWVVIRSKQTPAETPPAPATSDTTPETTKTVESTMSVWAEPTTIPFDLIAELDEPDSVWWLGVWSGVAVFELQYDVSGATDEIHTSSSTLRAVDVATGKILWTYDMYPDVGAWFSTGAGQVFDIASDGEDLAIVFNTQGSPSLEVFDPAGTRVIVMSLRTGERSSVLLDSQMGKDASGIPVSWMWGLVGFDRGTLVIERVASSDDTVPQTRAYAKDNLNTPSWTISGTVLRDNSPIPLGDRRLPGGYVLAVTGEYVGIRDGEPSRMTLFSADNSNQSVYSGKDGVILVDTYSTSLNEYGAVERSSLLSTAALDPSTLAPKWTYQPPQSSDGHFLPNECTAHGNLLYLPPTPDQTYLYSVSMDTGKQEWETSLELADYYQSCTEFWSQDMPIVSLMVSPAQPAVKKAMFLDATTGNTIATISADEVFTTHDGMIGTLTVHEDTQTLSVINSDLPSVTPLWTRDVLLVFRGNDESGMMLGWTPVDMSGASVFAVHEDGKYEFIIM